MSTATETAGSPHIDHESLKLLVRPVTASNGWRADELSAIDGSGEVAWYRGVQTCHEGELSAGRLQRGMGDALDGAYRDKCGHSSSAVARVTILRVDPA